MSLLNKPFKESSVKGRALRRAAIAGGISAVLLATAACSSTTSPAASSASTASATTGTAEATIWGRTGSMQTILDPSLVDWNKANPNEKVVSTYFANDAYKTKIRTAIGAGSAPTIIFNWTGSTLNSYIGAGKVVDLTSAASGLADKYVPSVWSQGVVDGKVYAVPMDAISPIILYFNQDVLDKAGVSAPKTWDDVLAAVPVLKAAGVAPFSVAGGSKWPLMLWEEYLVDRVAGPEAFAAIMAGKPDAWSNPGIIKANTMIQQLVDAGGFVDGFSSVTSDSAADVALLYTGKAAMLLQGAWVYNTLRTQAPDFVKSGLGFTTFPTVSGGAGDPTDLVGMPSGGFYSVSADATPEEQKTAIDYVTKGVFDDAYTKRMIEAGLVPPLQGLENTIATSGSAHAKAVYAMTTKSANFQLQWDQALPAAQATALLSNLADLFNKQITPQEFSDNMNKTIGQ
ncbi:extracellular solute-binding protein [Demequina lutea]|uniref:Raffinose/stachyose/melibiose transport system substrate-binding protein n=1 Tax=Demequina lutea TaxID=431489 RepID=A0A7Z0CJ97_9MICO|nr:extracellular solute-binding protein [Demequina lutea]NYI42779.1 raffinose/stachyose/melibiose transport system substrate-binding protein [Demequina lutea]